MNFRKAFSLIEILVVIGIAAGIFVMSAPFSLNFYRTQLVEETRDNVIDALQTARHNAVLQKNDSDFGLHLIAGSYTIFQGTDYEVRAQEQDEVFPVIDAITFSGSADIIFSKLTGVSNATGTINITYGNISKGILVENSGVISKVDVVDGEVVFSSTFAVSFDANGGTGSMADQVMETGVAENLNTNTFTNGYYSFNGWSTSADGSGTSYANGASYTINNVNHTLYAQWVATVSGAPTIGTATAGNTQATVTYSAPVSNGGSAITAYTVTSSPGGITASGASSPITVTGLTNDIAYTFTVTATNAIGTSAASAASNSVTPNDRPISYWAFNGNANDSVGSNNGTVSGATLTTGTKGVANTAYSFDGNDKITMATESNFDFPRAQAFSFNMWVKTSATSTMGLYSKGVCWGPGIELLILSTGQAMYNICGNFPSYLRKDSIGTINDNQWHYLSFTYDGSSVIAGLKLYIDGVATSTTTYGPGTLTSEPLTNNTPAFGYTYGWTSYFKGSMDEVRVYNRTLTAEEVTALYDADKPVVPGAPTIGTATSTVLAQATVTYTAPASNGGSAITSYTVTSSPGGISTTTTSATSAVVTGLSNSTDYTFTVTATNAIGTSASSVPSNSVTTKGVPGAPTIGTAVSSGLTQATVTYTTPVSNGGLTITSYTVTSSPGGISTTTTSTTSAVVTGLTNNTTYTFTVIATNAAGNSPASSASNSVITGSCTSPDDCYGSAELIANGITYLDGQLLRWSNASAPTGKGESYTYGHWYKDGQPNVHLVDNLSSSHVKTTDVYIDVTNYVGTRANNGLYYVEVGAYGLSTQFGIGGHSAQTNATHCNWGNIYMNTTNVCANLSMRLPRVRETFASASPSNDSCAYSGGPVLSAANGVPMPSAGGYWQASAATNNTAAFIVVLNSGSAAAWTVTLSGARNIICVAQ